MSSVIEIACNLLINESGVVADVWSIDDRSKQSIFLENYLCELSQAKMRVREEVKDELFIYERHRKKKVLVVERSKAKNEITKIVDPGTVEKTSDIRIKPSSEKSKRTLFVDLVKELTSVPLFGMIDSGNTPIHQVIINKSWNNFKRISNHDFLLKILVPFNPAKWYEYSNFLMSEVQDQNLLNVLRIMYSLNFPTVQVYYMVLSVMLAYIRKKGIGKNKSELILMIKEDPYLGILKTLVDIGLLRSDPVISENKVFKNINSAILEMLTAYMYLLTNIVLDMSDKARDCVFELYYYKISFPANKLESYFLDVRSLYTDPRPGINYSYDGDTNEFQQLRSLDFDMTETVFDAKVFDETRRTFEEMRLYGCANVCEASYFDPMIVSQIQAPQRTHKQLIQWKAFFELIDSNAELKIGRSLDDLVNMQNAQELDELYDIVCDDMHSITFEDWFKEILKMVNQKSAVQKLENPIIVENYSNQIRSLTNRKPTREDKPLINNTKSLVFSKGLNELVQAMYCKFDVIDISHAENYDIGMKSTLISILDNLESLFIVKYDYVKNLLAKFPPLIRYVLKNGKVTAEEIFPPYAGELVSVGERRVDGDKAPRVVANISLSSHIKNAAFSIQMNKRITKFPFDKFVAVGQDVTSNPYDSTGIMYPNDSFVIGLDADHWDVSMHVGFFIHLLKSLLGHYAKYGSEDIMIREGYTFKDFVTNVESGTWTLDENGAILDKQLGLMGIACSKYISPIFGIISSFWTFLYKSSDLSYEHAVLPSDLPFKGIPVTMGKRKIVLIPIKFGMLFSGNLATLAHNSWINYFIMNQMKRIISELFGLIARDVDTGVRIVGDDAMLKFHGSRAKISIDDVAQTVYGVYATYFLSSNAKKQGINKIVDFIKWRLTEKGYTVPRKIAYLTSEKNSVRPEIGESIAAFIDKINLAVTRGDDERLLADILFFSLSLSMLITINAKNKSDVAVFIPSEILYLPFSVGGKSLDINCAGFSGAWPYTLVKHMKNASLSTLTRMNSAISVQFAFKHGLLDVASKIKTTLTSSQIELSFKTYNSVVLERDRIESSLAFTDMKLQGYSKRYLTYVNSIIEQSLRKDDANTVKYVNLQYKNYFGVVLKLVGMSKAITITAFQDEFEPMTPSITPIGRFYERLLSYGVSSSSREQLNTSRVLLRYSGITGVNVVTLVDLVLKFVFSGSESAGNELGRVGLNDSDIAIISEAILYEASDVFTTNNNWGDGLIIATSRNIIKDNIVLECEDETHLNGIIINKVAKILFVGIGSGDFPVGSKIRISVNESTSNLLNSL